MASYSSSHGSVNLEVRDPSMKMKVTEERDDDPFKSRMEDDSGVNNAIIMKAYQDFHNRIKLSAQERS